MAASDVNSTHIANGAPAQLPERKRNPFLRSPTGGRLLSAMMLPLFWLRAPVGFGVLTTTGRRTGKRRRKCIRVIRCGHEAYLVMIRPNPAAIQTRRISAWVLNIRAHPDVLLRTREGTFTGRARELSDPGEREAAAEAYCRAVNLFDYVECVFHRGGLPTRAKIVDLHRSWLRHGVALAIELDDARSCDRSYEGLGVRGRGSVEPCAKRLRWLRASDTQPRAILVGLAVTSVRG